MKGPARARGLILMMAASAAAMTAFGAAGAVASGPRIALTPSTVHRGHKVRVHGTISACPTGDTVTLLSRAFPRRHTFAGVPAVSATVGKEGAYSVSVRVPAGKRPGAYGVTGRCGGGNLGVSVTLHVRR
jgi:hypothetical protein